MRRERDYQPTLIKKLRDMFPGCVILKNDSSYLQGIPDLLILWYDRWGILEVKRTMPNGPDDYEPNQEWYLDQLNQMSFAAMICPENEQEILDALQHAFTARRKARVS
jgi:hypothetical protein